MVGILGWCLG
jgi:hypothetical protein